MPTQTTILSPSDFAWLQLGMRSLYEWQIECLESIGQQNSAVVRKSIQMAKKQIGGV